MVTTTGSLLPWGTGVSMPELSCEDSDGEVVKGEGSRGDGRMIYGVVVGELMSNGIKGR